MAHTRIVAPASGMPRVLKTMSSLREHCACAGATTAGHTCSASVTSAHRNRIVLARLKRGAIFDRIIGSLVQHAPVPRPSWTPNFRGQGKVALCSMNFLYFAVWRMNRRINSHNKILEKPAQPQKTGHRQLLRKTCHGLEKFAQDKYSHFMEIHTDPHSTHHALRPL